MKGALMKSSKSHGTLKVLFSSAITHDSLECFYRKVIPRLTKSDHLELHIDSRGGEVTVALGLARFLVSLKGKVTTYNDGHCDSAAVVVFASGKERVVWRGSQFVMHEVGIETTGLHTLSTLAKVQKVLRRDTERITRFLERRTGRDALLWECDMRRNRCLSVDMALRNGLVTQIGGTKTDGYSLTI